MTQATQVQFSQQAQEQEAQQQEDWRPPPTPEQQPTEEEMAAAYFKSQYKKHFEAAKKAAREGIAACDKLEALAVLNGQRTEEGKNARSYFRMAANKLDKE